MRDQSQKRVVLIGGGHTHALVLEALKSNPIHGMEVLVINPGKTAPYSGMLPGFVAGHYTRNQLDINLDELCAAVGARLLVGRAVAMELESKAVLLEDGSKIGFDIASVDVGITSRMTELEGFVEHAVPAKPLGELASKWDAFVQTDGSKNIAVIGGGIAGAELAMAMSYALHAQGKFNSIKLLDRGSILSQNSATAQRSIRKALALNKVEIVEGVDVVKIDASRLICKNGQTHFADFIIGTAGATPHEWIENTGLKLHQGFIEVDETLRSSAENVFAVGDCAHMSFDPRPKAGVYAVRQAPILSHNLRNLLTGQLLRKYQPQSDYLKLVSLGEKKAFGEKLGVGLTGHLVWRLKDLIDRAFMDQF